MGQWPECGPRYQHNQTHSYMLQMKHAREVSSSRCCIYRGFCNVRFTWLQAGPVCVPYLYLLYQLLLVQQNYLDVEGLYGGPTTHLEASQHLKQGSRCNSRVLLSAG